MEALGKTMIGLQANVNYHNVAMGQGQDWKMGHAVRYAMVEITETFQMKLLRCCKGVANALYSPRTHLP